MRVLGTLARGPRTSRNYSFSDLQPSMALEARLLTVPLFLRINGTFAQARANVGNAPPIIAVDPVRANTGFNTGTAAPPPGTGSGSITETSSGYSAAQTTTGPLGASGVEVDISLTASLTGTINAGVATGAAAGASAQSQNGTGTLTPISWNVVDSNTPPVNSGFVTAILNIQGNYGAGPSTNIQVMEAATMTFTSNQISAFMNTNGFRGLVVFDNTVPGGPQMVYNDPTAGQYRGSPNVNPPANQLYGTAYEVTHRPVTLPFVEAVTYQSTLGVAPVAGGVGAGRTLAMQPTFKVTFNLSNN